MKRELERIEIPGEHDARVRTWETVQEAYVTRETVERPTPFVRPLLVFAAAAALLAAAFSPPGRAVIESVGNVIGVADAERSLFSVPGDGRMLVVADSGAWTVAGDGTRRRLGDYRDAAWSPFGRFIVAVHDDELAALEPDGDVRWKLARRGVGLPSWGGSSRDTRIAYLSRGALRVVGGDGRGDTELVGRASAVAPAWRPATLHFLAYAAGGRVAVRAAGGGRVFWSRRAPNVAQLEWSQDGELLLVRGPRYLRVYDQHGTLRHGLIGGAAASVTAAAFGRDSRSVAFVQQARGRSHVWVISRLRPDASRAREVFSGPGAFTDVHWSPDGRWLLVAWRDADQWLFVSTSGARRVRAVANVSEHFDSRAFPRVKGWVSRESP